MGLHVVDDYIGNVDCGSWQDNHGDVREITRIPRESVVVPYLETLFLFAHDANLIDCKKTLQI